MNEQIRMEDRNIKVFGDVYKTGIGTKVQEAKIYDAKSGDPLMEDITLTSFNIDEDDRD